MDPTYTFLFTPGQYTALVDRAAELDIPFGGPAPPGHAKSNKGGRTPCLT